MTDQERPRLPEIKPHEARRQAEDFLGHGAVDVDISRAIAYGLLAVAGELAAIRTALKK